MALPKSPVHKVTQINPVQTPNPLKIKTITPPSALTADERQVLAKISGETDKELGFWYIHQGDRRESWGNSPDYTVQKCQSYQRHGMEAGIIERLVESDYEGSLDAIQRVMLELPAEIKEAVNTELMEAASRANPYIWELRPIVWCRAVLAANK